MDQAEVYPKISVQNLKGLNERKMFVNPDLGEFDILSGCVPTTQGALSRINGIKFLNQILGEQIYGFCQTNDSRGNILVQTKTTLYLFSSDEFFGHTPFITSLTSISTTEEDTMAEALIVHQLAANVGGGTSTTSYAQVPLSGIVHQVNADGSAASFATLAANQVTLAAGKYRIYGWAKGSDNAAGTSCRTMIYNVSAGAPLWNGQANQESDEGKVPVANRNLRMEFGGFISLATPTIIELRQKASVALATNGLGFPTNDGGKEIYRWLRILQTGT